MPVEVDGHELVFRFRRPTQREWLEVLPAMTAIDSTMRTWALNAARATASGESIPRLSIGWEDVEPVRVFVADHIRGVDGLSYGDAAVAWPELAEEDRAQVLDLLVGHAPQRLDHNLQLRPRLRTLTDRITRCSCRQSLTRLADEPARPVKLPSHILTCALTLVVVDHPRQLDQ